MSTRPRTIQFEISTFCNANCVFCPRGSMTRPQGTMSDEMFHKIIREGKAMGVHRFIPFLNGEPFMNRQIFDWLDYMQAEKVSTCLFTNAELLDKEKIDKLIKYTNIEYINCSFNAATEETRIKIMPGSNYERTKKNIEYLISVAPFKIKVGMTVIEENQPEVEAFGKLWGSHSKFGDFVNWAGNKHDLLEKSGDRIPCPQLLEHLNILWDGRVCLCCFDFDGQVILGDLNKQSLEEIWNNSKTLRDRHLALDFKMNLCDKCNANAHKQNLINKKI